MLRGGFSLDCYVIRCAIGGDYEVIYDYSKQKETINVKSKKTKIYQEKQTLVTSTHPSIEIRTNHRNKTLTNPLYNLS